MKSIWSKEERTLKAMANEVDLVLVKVDRPYARKYRLRGAGVRDLLYTMEEARSEIRCGKYYQKLREWRDGLKKELGEDGLELAQVELLRRMYEMFGDSPNVFVDTIRMHCDDVGNLLPGWAAERDRIRKRLARIEKNLPEPEPATPIIKLVVDNK